MEETAHQSFSFNFAIRSAGRMFLLIFLAVSFVGIARIIIDCVFDGWKVFDWNDVRTVVITALTLSAIWSVMVFLSSYTTMLKAVKTDEILDDDLDSPTLDQQSIRGFLAMEYYFLILNRSFVVFISDEGLYGWKFSGPVSADNPAFYIRYKDYLEDKNRILSPQVIHKLSQEDGGFFIPRNQIQSVKFVDKQKWGMGGIAHSGKLYVRQVDKGKREFILLGYPDGIAIEEAILNKYGTPPIADAHR